MTNRRHRSIRFALVLSGTCALLLILTALISAESNFDPQRAEAGQTIPSLPATILLTKTVGVDPDTCATRSSLLTPPETVVYYCYRVRNTSDVILKFHQLFDDDFAEPIIPDGFHYDLKPGEVITTVEMGFVATRTITRTTTNVAQWESYIDDDLYAQDIATATVAVRTPRASLEARVGAGDGCAGSASLVGARDMPYAWCIVLTNTGEITLTDHTLTIPELGVSLTRTRPLAPNASIIWTRSDDPALGGYTIAGDLVIYASLGSTYSEAGVEFAASAEASAGVFMLDQGDSHAWLPLVRRE